MPEFIIESTQTRYFRDVIVADSLDEAEDKWYQLDATDMHEVDSAWDILVVEEEE